MGPTINCNGKVQREILRVSSIVFEEYQTIVQLWVKRSKVVQEALFAKPLSWVSTPELTVIVGQAHLGEEKPSERDINKYSVIHCLAQYPS